MTDIKNVFDIAARSMSAQMVRLNTVASNLANARSVAVIRSQRLIVLLSLFLKLFMQMIWKKPVFRLWM